MSNGTEKELTMKIFVLVIQHNHGQNVSLFADENGANYALLQYVKMEWQEENIGRAFSSLSSDGAIEHYFEYHEDESYGIHLRELPRKPQHPTDTT